MTSPLPTKSVPLKGEWDTQSLLEFLSAILSFFDLKEFASHLLIGHCPYRQPNNNRPEEIGDKKKQKHSSLWCLLHCTRKFQDLSLSMQCAKKVVSNSLELVDLIAIGRMNPVLNLPKGQVNFFGEIQTTEELLSMLLSKNSLGAS